MLPTTTSSSSRRGKRKKTAGEHLQSHSSAPFARSALWLLADAEPANDQHEGSARHRLVRDSSPCGHVRKQHRAKRGPRQGLPRDRCWLFARPPPEERRCRWGVVAPRARCENDVRARWLRDRCAGRNGDRTDLGRTTSSNSGQLSTPPLATAAAGKRRA